MALKIICTLLAVVFVVGYANAASSGKAITAADIPTTPTATTCKANLDAAAAAFAAAGNAITGVKQIAGASKSNYIFCMEIKDPKDTATIDLNIEPAYVGTPFSTLLTNPAYPQLPAYITAIYQAAAAMTPGGYGLATYPWDLSNIANATPADQKTSLLEKLSSGTANYVCGCGISTAPVSSTRRMLA
ncbi:hypothetical protein CVIRNUC_010550 [Coccomyxa viridis]|uniref:Extracellular protein n=1 Tax=Coccomyxa viridis TaxID=1274662 RepID=A0AAV1IM69_9CHLO|nr:hypothetical protein CVIRNUC_010550 [Coccomyxa viridis]